MTYRPTSYIYLAVIKIEELLKKYGFFYSIQFKLLEKAA